VPPAVAVHAAAYDKSSTAVAARGDERTGRSPRRRRETAIPVGRQTRDTVLRVAKGHHGPGVVGPVPVVLRRVLRRLLDIVHHRVPAEIVNDEHLRRDAARAHIVIARYNATQRECITIITILLMISDHVVRFSSPSAFTVASSSRTPLAPSVPHHLIPSNLAPPFHLSLALPLLSLERVLTVSIYSLAFYLCRTHSYALPLKCSSFTSWSLCSNALTFSRLRHTQKKKLFTIILLFMLYIFV